MNIWQWIQWVNVVVVVLGIPAIVWALIRVEKKLLVLDSLEKTIKNIDHDLKVVTDYLDNRDEGFDSSGLQTTD